MIFSFEEASKNLSMLVEMAEQGEEVLLARAGRPVVRIMRVAPKKNPIRFGTMKDKIWMAEDFDDPLPANLQKEFEAPFY